jgi:hypothetical protein
MLGPMPVRRSESDAENQSMCERTSVPPPVAKMPGDVFQLTANAGIRPCHRPRIPSGNLSRFCNPASSIHGTALCRKQTKDP